VNVNVQEDHTTLSESSSFAPNSHVLQRAIQFETDYFPSHENYHYISNQNMQEDFHSFDATLPKTSYLQCEPIHETQTKIKSVEQYFEIQKLQDQITYLKQQQKVQRNKYEKMVYQQYHEQKSLQNKNLEIKDLHEKLDLSEKSRCQTQQTHRAVKANNELMNEHHENEVSELKKENEKTKEFLKNEIMEKNELLENISEKVRNEQSDTLAYENLLLNEKNHIIKHLQKKFEYSEKLRIEKRDDDELKYQKSEKLRIEKGNKLQYQNLKLKNLQEKLEEYKK
jgi:hypothetical protein